MLAWLKRLFRGALSSNSIRSDEDKWMQLAEIIRQTEIKSRELTDRYRHFAKATE